MENRSNGLIDPNKISQIMNQKHNQIKEVRFRKDGLMERDNGKVVTEDGRELLREGDVEGLNPEIL